MISQCTVITLCSAVIQWFVYIKGRFFREIVFFLYKLHHLMAGFVVRAAGVFTWSSVVEHLVVDFGVWWRWKRPVAVRIASRRSALLDRKIDLARLTMAAGR